MAGAARALCKKIAVVPMPDEDLVLEARVRMASEKGLIGEDETRQFIERMLNADP